jgi:hypothetical protein
MVPGEQAMDIMLVFFGCAGEDTSMDSQIDTQADGLRDSVTTTDRLSSGHSPNHRGLRPSVSNPVALPGSTALPEQTPNQ